MAQKLKGRHFICLKDFTNEEVYQMIDLGVSLKAKQYSGEPHRLLEGKTLGMIFQKSSTRTRISFETGIYQLGGLGMYLSSNDLQLGRGETIQDTARVISRYLDGIMARVFAHSDITELAKYSRVPVINGLTDFNHPCQIVADLMTIYEKFRKLEGLKLTYIGDGNNVAHSLLYGCAKMGVSISIACPGSHRPDKEVVDYATEEIKKFGGEVLITDNIDEAVKGSNVIYTDVWTSMGQEAEKEERLKLFKDYQVNGELLKKASDDCLVMHCLPAHRGEEITDEVMDGPQSIVFDQAENRLHAQKAIMALLM